MRKAHNAIDMTGQTYNSWLVIEPVPGTGKKSGGKMWKARCLECHDVYTVSGANIRSGASKRCVKCGCGHGHAKQEGQIRTKRTPEESAFHYLFLQLRKDAKKRGQDWQLTPERTKELVTHNCIYCNAVPSLETNPIKWQGLANSNNSKSVIKRNGIDRVDPSKGYIEGNVVPCCKQCNLAKLDYTVEEFKAWAIRLASNLMQMV